MFLKVNLFYNNYLLYLKFISIGEEFIIITFFLFIYCNYVYPFHLLQCTCNASIMLVVKNEYMNKLKSYLNESNLEDMKIMIKKYVKFLQQCSFFFQ